MLKGKQFVFNVVIALENHSFFILSLVLIKNFFFWLYGTISNSFSLNISTLSLFWGIKIFHMFPH